MLVSFQLLLSFQFTLVLILMHFILDNFGRALGPIHCVHGIY